MADNPLGDLLGGDGEPWALEATQKNIENHLESLVKSFDSKVSKKLDIIEKNIKMSTGYDKSLNDLAKEEKKRGVKADQKSDKQESYFKKLQNLLSGRKEDSISDRGARNLLGGKSMLGNIPIIGGAIGYLGNTISTVTQNISNLDSGLTVMLKSVLVIGPALGFMSGWIGNTIDSYREMQMSGLTFGGSMFSLSIMAGEAGLDLGTFSKIILANSKLMKGIGGPQVLADTVDAIRKTGSAFGYSMESLTEFSADYLDQLKVSGVFERITDQQRKAGAARYVAELNNMAELTGRSAKELSAEQRKAARNTKVLAAGLGLSGEELIKYQENIATISLHSQRFGAEFGTSIIEMAAHASTFGGNFAASGPLGRFVASVPSLNTAFTSVVDVLNNGGDMDAAMMNLGTAFDNMSDSELKRIEIQAQRGNVEAQQIVQMMVQNKMYKKQRELEIKNLIDNQNMSREQAIIELGKRKEATTSFLGIQEKLQDAFGKVKSSIIRALFDSGVFEKLGEMSEYLVKQFQASSGGIASMIKSIAPFLDRFKGFLADLEGDDKMNIIQKIILAVNQALFGKAEPGEEQFTMLDKIGEKFGELMKNIPWGKIIGGMLAGLAGAFIAYFSIKTFSLWIVGAASGLLATLATWVGAVAWPAIMSGLGSLFVSVGTFIVNALIIGGSAILTAIGGIPLAIIAGIVAIGAGIIALFYFWDDIETAWNEHVPSWEDIKALIPDWLSIDYWAEKFREWEFSLPSWEELKSYLPEWLQDPIGFFANFFKSLAPDWLIGGAESVGKGAAAIGEAAGGAYTWAKGLFGGNDETTSNLREPAKAQGIGSRVIATGTDNVAVTDAASINIQAVTGENTIRTLEKLLDEATKQNAILISIAQFNKTTMDLNKDLLSKIVRGYRLN